jgi:hypothetical protein
MQEIKKIKIMSLAKIAMLFGVLPGIIYGIQIGLASTVSPLTFAEATSYAMQDPIVALQAYLIALGWWSLIIAPILIGSVYFVAGIIVAWLYNMFVKAVGGIKIELVEKDVKKKK